MTSAQRPQPRAGHPGANARSWSPLVTHLKTRLAVMHPAYFALVMATAVVGIACHLLGLREFAVALSWINLVAYPTLWVLFIARAVMFPEHVAADLRDHARAPGYFAVVAATGMMGTQAAVLHEQFLVAHIMWWVS
ncbi:MAG: C4-dicarboxylate ABC transporter, partial [Acidobacteria bacterium]|nr:C4-dicarboxylate ABC transporter [Acidobacteriota bacterium]